MVRTHWNVPWEEWEVMREAKGHHAGNPATATMGMRTGVVQHMKLRRQNLRHNTLLQKIFGRKRLLDKNLAREKVQKGEPHVSSEHLCG